MIRYYFISLIGAFVTWLFIKKRKDIDALSCIRYINEKWEENPWAKLLDMLIFIGVGGIIGILLMEPANDKQALISGISWVSLVSQIASKKEESNDGEN